MHRYWISISLVPLLAVGLTGCATSKEKLLTHDDATMLDIWNRQTSASPSWTPATRQLLDARQALRRPLTRVDEEDIAANAGYTRTAQNEIERQFHRLPNPDLAMYVLPHLAGTDPAPIPGYSTVFPLHGRVHYALPGERTEDY